MMTHVVQMHLKVNQLIDSLVEKLQFNRSN